MDKLMSYEEWLRSWDRGIFMREAMIDGGIPKELWYAARQGMIPADRAIEIPDVSEWPEWAEEVRVFFSNSKDGDAHYGTFIRTITRPVHVWVPKEGEPVFVGNSVSVGIVERKMDSGRIKIQGYVFPTEEENLKPFDPAKIGRPWSEI